MSYGFFGGPVWFIDGFVRGLGGRKCDFLMVKTWTNCGESVVVCGFFVGGFRNQVTISRLSGLTHLSVSRFLQRSIETAIFISSR